MKNKFLLYGFILMGFLSSCGDKNYFSFNDFPEIITGTWEYEYQRVLIKNKEDIDSIVINEDNIKFQMKVDKMQISFLDNKQFIVSFIDNEKQNQLLRQNGSWKLNNDSLQLIFSDEDNQIPETYFCQISKDTTMQLSRNIIWDDDKINDDKYSAILKKIK